MSTNLEIYPLEYSLIYDDLDTNAITFELDQGYFTIQTGVYLEEEEDLNEPSFELNDQGDSQNGGLEKIIFTKSEIIIQFKNSYFFLYKYETIKINLKEEISRKIVDFFANHLFLGDFIFYDEKFDQLNKVSQTAKRDYL
jgi:hypothetical protein